MPHTHTNTIDEDISSFANTVPPPPYSVTGNTGEPRPKLPEEKRNVHLNTREFVIFQPRVKLISVPGDAHLVKFQTIVRDGKEIVVGRVKVPTVSILRSLFSADE